MNPTTPPHKDTSSKESIEEPTKKYEATRKSIDNLVDLAAVTLIDLFRKPLKNRLIALAALLVAFGNPFLVKIYLNFFSPDFWSQIADIYSPAFYTTVAGAITIAIVLRAVEIDKEQHKDNQPDLYRSASAIKGLYAFGYSDKETFRQLQRNREIRLVTDGILQDNYSVGILFGESGCGKSSFLQAGIKPALEEKGASCLIATLSNEDPLISIGKACRMQVKAYAEPEHATDLYTLLKACTPDPATTVVVVLDQFEQLFTQFKTSAQRREFIDQLDYCYQNIPNLKLLFSIRLDFMGYCHELQEIMKFALTAQENSFRLLKFKTEQVTAIFQVMANDANLPFDGTFVQHLAETELTSKEDGLVSAVDIQIVASIIANSADSEQLGFNEKSIQGLGGANGLFVRYLREKFQEPNIFNQDGLCLRILLLLIDQPNNVRAGRLTREQLKEKLHSSVNDEYFTQALEWLQKLRLIVEYPDPIQGEQFELAHERLVNPVRVLSRTELNDVEKARLLWEQRTNEWLANNRLSKYTLPWGEWRLIKRMKPQLETNEAREDLLQATKQQFFRLAGIVAVLLLLLIAGTGTSQTDWWVIENRLESELSKGLTQHNNWPLILDSTYRPSESFLWKKIDNIFISIQQLPNSSSKAEVFGSLAAAAATLKDTARATAFLDLALTAAQQLPDADSKADMFSRGYKAEVFGSLAAAAATLKDTARATALLDLALTAAQQLPDASSKTEVYRRLAAAAATLKDTARATAFLDLALTAAQQLPDADSKAEVFGSLAAAAATLKDTARATALLDRLLTAAQQLPDADSKADMFSRGYKAEVYSRLAAAAATLKDTARATALLDRLLTAAQQLPDADSKTEVYSSLAAAAATLKDTARATALLDLALTAAQQLPDADSKTEVFGSLAAAAATLKDTARATALLDRLLTAAQQLPDADSKVEVYSRLAAAAATLKDTARATALLDLALTAAQQLPDASSKTEVYRRLAAAAAILKDTARATALLDLALTAAQQLPDADSKADMFSRGYKTEVYRRLAAAAATLKDTARATALLDLALTAAQQLPDASSKTEVYRRLAAAAATLKDTARATAFLDLALTAAQQLPDASSKTEVYRRLAEVAANIKSEEKLKQLADKYATVQDQDLLSLVIKLYSSFGLFQRAYDISKNLGNAADRQKAQLLILKAYYAKK